jgi:O-antigen/teichoic acid export membrane protein
LLAIGFVSSVLRDQTDKIVLALFGSALLVGYYGIAVRLASLLNEVSRLFYLPLLNAAGALNATGAWSAIQELYGTAMRLVPLATGILLIVVGGLANQVITLWIGTPTPAVIPFLLILLLGNVAAVTLTGPGTSICRGIGRVEIETAYVLTNLVGNIVLTILLVHAIGAFGTVIASSVTWAVSSIVFLILLHRRLALPVARSQSAVLALVAAAAIAMALVATIPPSLGTQSRASALLSIIVLGIPSAFIYLVFAFWLGLVPREAPRIASRWIAGALPR